MAKTNRIKCLYCHKTHAENSKILKKHIRYYMEKQHKNRFWKKALRKRKDGVKQHFWVLKHD